MKVTLFVSGTFLFLLSACVTPIPMTSITYPGNATVKSSMTAKVNVSSSGIGGMTGTRITPVAGIFVATPQKINGSGFDEKNQQDFEQLLRRELVRLGIVKSAVANADTKPEITANVNIERAMFSFDKVEYTLDVVLDITGGPKPFQRQYHIVSTEKDSTWDKLNTNGAEARAKIMRLLLEKLVPDIEFYVSSMLAANQSAPK